MAIDYPAILDELRRGAPNSVRSLGGGCIADACVAEFRDGSRAFVKRRSGTSGMFPREAEGLQALGAAGAIRVPQVLAVCEHALVLEWIDSAAPAADFFPDFGQRFAALHGRRGPACGFTRDNFIGATPQRNRPVGDFDLGGFESGGEGDGRDWPAFFIERRLHFQAELAAGADSGALLRLLDRAEQRIRQALEAAIEPPSLLHGDLWSGNYLVDERGRACLIDPAVYFGHREADLAMTRLFGGFDRSFYAAYNDALPLTAGHEERLPVYQLYHLLNHFNLFGGGYHDESRRILQRWAGPAQK